MAPVIAIGIFLAHGRFSLRFAHILSGSMSLVVIWCLLSLGSLLLSATVAVGVYVLAFHITGKAFIGLISYFLFGLFALIAIPYHILLAIEVASVMRRGRDRHKDKLELILTLVLTVAFTAIWLQMLKLLPGVEVFD